MRIMVLGLRGFPGIQGGVESHAERLYPLLAKLGCDVEVLVRSSYWSEDRPHVWQGVRFCRLWSPKTKGLEALIHSLIGVIYACWNRPDVLHIHAIGPAIVTPIARLFGLRVVVTHHGPDYAREKWGLFARWVLHTGEKFGMRFSNQRIVISRVIGQMIQSTYGCDSVLIPNGVVVQEMPVSTGALERFSVKPGRYILNVSRFVPEKRHLDLMQAFAEARLPGWKLLLVGSLNQPDDYTRAVQAAADKTTDVILTGFQSGLALQELYAHAGIFVLPSSHEGLPIALLEALSYGLPVLASDIPANLEIGLPTEQYFQLGDIAMLARQLRVYAAKEEDPLARERWRNWVQERYDWKEIASQTLAVYSKAMN
jgi:glycosyltransferase involved in cell wall biosynthesis